MWETVLAGIALLTKLVDLIPKPEGPSKEQLEAEALKQEAESLDAPK